ncbi:MULTISPECIES: helix-turn-helix domain-containing protein [unclassified Bradyrhizobium]|uniref:helix-turn-helix domain-containing protein n=1 Tax=Bradyrhizobium sp. USDA 4541 TaxID=2817704 RepID=UPI0020A2E567|nr:winged helix-turn-helix domain-containing protein [Bradyrhizobium sp. USDA 4541]MCP1852848.1 DNA-binding response OmpR family regulator [Bradyrhizobium sp. USDA 4541]
MLSITPDQLEIRRLRERIAQLEAENTHLSRLIEADQIVFPREWDLLPQEARALRSLYTAPNGIRSGEVLLRAMVSRSATADAHLVQVVICRLRAKLKHLDIEIENRRSIGYGLTPASREIVAKSLVTREVRA